VDVTNRNLGLPRADLILLTHGHTDHINTTALSNVTNSDTIIIASGWAWSNLTTSLKALTTVITNGATTNALGITVDAVAMYNTNAAQSHPKGWGNGYVLNMAGRRIYFSGDTDNTPEMRALTNIDVAFLAMRGPNANMDIADAVNATRVFRPRIVYPYHYTGRDPNSYKLQLGTDLGIEVRLRKWY
jgi:L-ascorbate metabolism protein UlaG (beta-lactamase superfamily)